MSGNNIEKNIETIYPLSPMQQGMLFEHLLAEKSGTHNIQWTCILQPDIPAFIRAWERVIEYHDVLRAAFIWEELDEPLQVVGRKVKLPLQEYDWRDLSSAQQREQGEKFLQDDSQRSFNLSEAPHMRLTLIRLSDTVYQFIWTIHPSLVDGWSSHLLLEEVFTLYEDQTIPLEQSRPYADYIAWLQQQDPLQAETFWQQQLKGFVTPLDLGMKPTSEKQARVLTYHSRGISLSQEQTAALHTLAKQQRLTLNTLIQGAWAVLLSRYSGQADVVFGEVVSGRPSDLKGSEAMVGLFLNTLPVRVMVSSDVMLLPWLQALQNQQVEARQYGYSPLVQIRGWSDLPHDQEIFSSILVFNNYPISALLQEKREKLQIEHSRFIEHTTYPLTVDIMPASELLVNITYDGDMLNEFMITCILYHFQALLENIIANPNQRLSTLSLWKQAEYKKLLQPGSIATYPCIHASFEKQVEYGQDAIAVSFEDENYSYNYINSKSNQLTYALLEMGTPSQQQVISTLLTNGVLQIISLLAILKSGNTFVCLENKYPTMRLQQIVEETQSLCIITEEACLEGHGDLIQKSGVKTIILDHHSEKIPLSVLEGYPQINPQVPVSPTDYAYIAYTSGSTGKPKGTVQSHQSFSQFITWQSRYFGIEQAKRIVQWASIVFDASYCEIFGALCFGATVYLMEPMSRLDPLATITYLREKDISLFMTVPSYFRQMLRILQEQYIPKKQHPFPRLENMLLAGEVLQTDCAAAWVNYFADCPKLFNLYGPTESILATCYHVKKVTPEQSSISIGSAFDGRQILILDAEKRLSPLGGRGEIYIRSHYLTSGYFERPEETNRAFMQNPLHNDYQDPVYHTGDLGRWEAHDMLEFLGRIDNQVKIRGIRVELVEIESILFHHPAVDECVLKAYAYSEDDKRLLAYIVKRADAQISEAELRNFLKAHLPEHFIPSSFLFLDALPHTSTGKIDRKVLPIPDDLQPDRDRAYVEPETAIESTIAEIWRDLLHVDKINRHDDFFDLGGHSILMILVINKLRNHYSIDLTIPDFFEHTTVVELAQLIEERFRKKQRDIEMVIKQVQQLSEDEVKQLFSENDAPENNL